MSIHAWQPERHWLFLWRLEQVVFADFAGTGYRFLRYRNGFIRLFWTKAQAEAHAAQLNALRLFTKTEG